MSNMLNSYATLTEFRNLLQPPNQTLHEDAGDDAVIESLLEAASRRADSLCGKQFYPRIETLSFDIPYDNEIWFGEWLLSVISFTNGDGSTIAPAEYILKPGNAYPKYALRMRDISSVYWLPDSTTQSGELVLDITAYWGFHEEYARRAWKAVGTNSAVIADTTTKTIPMTAGHTLEARGGEIVKIEDELFNSASVVGNVLTVISRGDNGSTAATHAITKPVYVWTPADMINPLTLEIAKIMYHSRYGENVETTSTYTASGVIVTPRSLPVWAQEVIRRYQRIV